MINGEVELQSSKGLQILADLVAPSTFGIGSVKYLGFDYFIRQANNIGGFSKPYLRQRGHITKAHLVLK